jgi:hypothetical protein
MTTAAHIHGEGAMHAGCACGAGGPDAADSLARNLGRMCGHIAAAIRTPVVPQPGALIARRVSQCEAAGPDGTTLRRTVVDEIVVAPDSNPLREHHAS